MVRFGRYEVREPIAGGGMGVVYAAFDPDLDRRVACKVVHPRRKGDAKSQSRLLREARALAQLDHPNVVKVHDVISHDDQIVVVMELVNGETLANWEARVPRSCDEVMRAYVHAARGLVAAHALDIVHRDFKPSNAIIGDDGRVRVLDFGLAQFEHADDADAPVTSGAITKTDLGAVVGTLAYAAPEQLSGEQVTPASDQFSFCVALHRALERIAPFEGASGPELIASMKASPPALASTDRRVPAWLRAVVARGLAFDPHARHPSMAALLAELERPRGWKRWRVPTLVASGIAVAALTTAVVARDEVTQPSCDGGASDTAAVWSPAIRTALDLAFARIGTPYAREADSIVVDGLDGRVTAWRDVHRGACVAHQHAAASDLMFDREMACLHRNLDDMQAAIEVLAGTTAASVEQATSVVAEIPAPAECLDVTTQLTVVAPPRSPAIAAQVDLVRDHLGAIAALRRAGRVEEAGPALRAALLEAKATAYAPVIAEAELEHGRWAIERSDFDTSTISILREATELALVNGLPSITIEAAARRIYIAAMYDLLSISELEGELPYLTAMARALTGDHLAVPLLLNNVGMAYKLAGRLDTARDYFEQAHVVMARDPAPDLELVAVDQNRAMLMADVPKREELLGAARDRLVSALGEHHVTALDAKIVLAMFTGDPKRALDRLIGACADVRHDHPTLVAMLVSCETYTGVLASELGDPVAESAYQTIVDVSRDSTDANVIAWRRLALAALAVRHGDRATAIAQYNAVIADRANSPHLWARYDAAYAQLGLGALTRDPALLDAAISTFEQVGTSYDWITCKVALAHARRERESIIHR